MCFQGPTWAATKAARAELIQRRNTTREEEGAFIFQKYSTSGAVSEEGLSRCFADMGFSNGRQNKNEAEMREWVRRELKKGDKKGDGVLTLSEFVDYYNRYVVGHRRQFEDTYELSQQIGKGAFGAVFRAKRIGRTASDASAGDQVAVKKVLKEGGVKMDLLHNGAPRALLIIGIHMHCVLVCTAMTCVWASSLGALLPRRDHDLGAAAASQPRATSRRL